MRPLISRSTSSPCPSLRTPPPAAGVSRWSGRTPPSPCRSRSPSSTDRDMHRCFCIFFALLCLLAGFERTSFAAEPSSAAILQDLRSFSTFGTVLMVAAHPDDENTQLIAYLSRGRNYRMGYLSITRGDGGQNVLGP